MKLQRSIVAIASLVFVPGCLIKPAPPTATGDGGAKPDARMGGGPADAGRGGRADGMVARVDADVGTHDYWVDGTSGSDMNPGTEAKPFATITHALGIAGSGDTVHVEPATYRPGQVHVPGGVLLTAAQGKGSATIIASQTTQNILLGAGATLSDFHIRLETRQGCAICLGSGSDGAVAKDNNIDTGGSTGGVGIQVSGGGRQIITGNEIRGCYAGIDFEGGTRTEMADNTATHNYIGVRVARTGADLGGGAAMSPGGNVFACNNADGLRVSTGVTVHAQANGWNHVPPTISCRNPADIGLCNSGSNAVITTGAFLAPNPCP